jgi:DNA-binding IclR family transcriptional regulator
MSQTVHRAINIIGFVSEEPRTLSQVGEHLGVHKSTALRLLQTLEQSGFVRHRDDGRWTIGVELIATAQRALDSIDIRAVAHPHLQRLSSLAGQTVHLGQLIGREVVYIDKVDGQGEVRMYSRIGRVASTHASGVSKAIVAFLEPPLIDEILGGIEFARYTKTTVTPLPAFRRELSRIAARGWATDNGEFEEFINCIAAPVRSSDGKVRNAVSIAAPKMVASLTDLEPLVPQLLETTRAISRDLGWHGGEK